VLVTTAIALLVWWRTRAYQGRWRSGTRPEGYLQTIPIELIGKSCHDLRVHETITTTEQRILTPRQLAAEVRRLTCAPAEWVARVRLDPEGRWYEQIRVDDALELWLISWLPGQSTGFHDHGGANGAFGVVWGQLDEHVLVRGVAAATANPVPAGEVRSFGPRYVHDVRNASSGSVAVSVHAYSPPLTAMRRYEMTAAGLALAGTDRAELDW
jgi:predicted metal-dependent enzyme (double-stranded beta helix superfamily)